MVEQRKRHVYVTLEGPDDGGDFGRNTPGTSTGGIQEGFDYAHANGRDMTIFGGRGGMHGGDLNADNVYTLHETLRVPWSQDFRLDGGNYVMSYVGQTGDAVVIDSQMSCKYKFGLVVSAATDGAAVRIQPKESGPDDFVTMVTTTFEFSAVVGSDVGILLDATYGNIQWCRILTEETNTMRTGVYIPDDGSARGVLDNVVEVLFTNQAHAVSDAVGFRIGDPGATSIRNNTFRSAIHAPRGMHLDPETHRYVPQDGLETPEGAIGAQIYAQGNVMHFSFQGNRIAGHDIVFGEGARDNTVHAFNLPHGITNRSSNSTNRVVTNFSLGFGVETPDFPGPGVPSVNTSSHTVQVFVLTPGVVSGWSVKDSNGAGRTFSGGLASGQSFLMDPGDCVAFEYRERPTWTWKAMK